MNVNCRFPYLFAVVFAAFSFCLVSCDNDDDDETKEYLDGTVSIGDYDVFVNTNSKITYHPSGVTHPDGKALGLYYKIYDVMSAYDTVYRADVNPVPLEKGKAEFTATYPDSLATFSMYVTYYPIDSDVYYSSSSTFYITTVDRDLSLPTVVTDYLKPHFYDTRDEESYNYVEIAGKYWMCSNLRYAGDEYSGQIGTAYYNCEAVRPIFGAFYTWDKAQVACPKGWRLPSNEDWKEMVSSLYPAKSFDATKDFEGVAGDCMADGYFNGDKMWEFWPEVKITNKSGLSLLPCGYFNAKTREDFKAMTDYGCFWTSDENPLDTKLGLFRYIYEKENDIKIGTADKYSMAMNVRCIKDK